MNQPSIPTTIEDVQNTVDTRSLAIDKVGIKSIRHPVVVKDKTGGEQHTVAMFNMYVHLPQQFKGT
ncbi:MAG TPA: GTP cyclohydrolase, FolE2/MptA family, partial [Methylotenera sp.]|nr:GTP cyclohydrolase, FolE2/MptA family [Methylotenera sp.]